MKKESQTDKQIEAECDIFNTQLFTYTILKQLSFSIPDAAIVSDTSVLMSNTKKVDIFYGEEKKKGLFAVTCDSLILFI